MNHRQAIKLFTVFTLCTSSVFSYAQMGAKEKTVAVQTTLEDKPEGANFNVAPFFYYGPFLGVGVTGRYTLDKVGTFQINFPVYDAGKALERGYRLGNEETLTKNQDMTIRTSFHLKQSKKPYSASIFLGNSSESGESTNYYTKGSFTAIDALGITASFNIVNGVMIQGDESNPMFDATNAAGEPSIDYNLVTGFNTSSLGIGFHYSKRVKFKGQFTTSDGMFDTEGKGKGARFFNAEILLGVGNSVMNNAYPLYGETDYSRSQGGYTVSNTKFVGTGFRLVYEEAGLQYKNAYYKVEAGVRPGFVSMDGAAFERGYFTLSFGLNIQ